MSKTRIYCAFTGTGKTYFCQHHAGWADIDEETAVKIRANPDLVEFTISNYIRYGYRIITNATPYVMTGLKKHLEKYELIIILPPPEMKEELLQRVKDRGDIEWYPYLSRIYDDFYQATINFDIPGQRIWLKPGQYLEDIIKQLEPESLD